MTAVYYQVRPNGGTDESLWLTVPAASLPQVVGSLAAGSFQVRALGASAWSSAVTVTDVPEEFDPVDLFGASDVGYIMDLRDGPVDLWQDTAGTNPVTAAGQSVALAGRLGAAGLRRFSQASAGSRPIYQEDGEGGYLEFNGSSAWMTEQSPAWAGKDNVSAMVLVRPNGSPTVRGAMASWKIAANEYTFLEAPAFSADVVRLERRAGTTSGAASGGVVSPWTQTHRLVSEITRVSGSTLARRNILNGVENLGGEAESGANTFTSAAWELGRRAQDNDRYFDGRLRALVVISRGLTSEERTAADAWLEG
jgi:hypothetical protein